MIYIYIFYLNRPEKRDIYIYIYIKLMQEIIFCVVATTFTILCTVGIACELLPRTCTMGTDWNWNSSHTYRPSLACHGNGMELLAVLAARRHILPHLSSWLHLPPPSPTQAMRNSIFCIFAHACHPASIYQLCVNGLASPCMHIETSYIRHPIFYFIFLFPQLLTIH